MDLHCARGTVTALVGRSGSGKSSLVSLLPRFYAPTAGRILLDDYDYETYKLASLRRQIAWVGQSVVLFDGTVAENIAYGELSGANEQDIVAAATAANAMEFIERLPHGIHSQIGAGRQYAFRGSTAAYCHRACDSEECADPGTRRGNQRAGY